MYTIIQTGGKQYRVSQGDELEVERLPLEVGAKVRFDQVLLIGGNAETQVGTPFLSQASVSGEVLKQMRGDKVIFYRYKRRKGYDKKRGHRQELTRVRITDIKADLTPSPSP